MAASGHDALDLLATGYCPHAIFMDLAMPGIDGWETLRRIRANPALGGTQPQVAIVSANAFDRGLDNGLGLPPEDFIVKPVRHTELLDWLERKLALEWVERKRGRVPCLVCRQTATHAYRPLAASAAVKGAYYLAHVPVDDPTEAARIVGWLTRWSHGL